MPLYTLYCIKYNMMEMLNVNVTFLEAFAIYVILDEERVVQMCTVYSVVQ